MTMTIIAQKNNFLFVDYLKALNFRTPYFLFGQKKAKQNYIAFRTHIKNFTIFHTVKASYFHRTELQHGC